MADAGFLNVLKMELKLQNFRKAGLFFFLSLFIPFIAAASIVEKSIDAKAIYRHWCAQCHGELGRGDGVNSTPDMAINPRDHTDAHFMSTRTDEQFEEVIMEGGAGIAKSPLMPPWGKTLTKIEIKALVGYLRELCKCEFEGVAAQRKLRKADPNFR